MTATSPWSRQAQAPAPPSVTLPPSPHPPPAPIPAPPAAAPSSGRHRRWWPWVVLGLLLAVVLSAAVGSVVTYAMVRNSAPVSPPSVSPTTTAPHFSVAEVEAAKQNLCQTFDVSVRGQEGQGGLRVEGSLNVSIILRTVNSAAAVQNALVPATPPDVAAAAKKYVSATWEQTTAAMGNTPTSEVNRLTDVRNDAIVALLDVCGLPR